MRLRNAIIITLISISGCSEQSVEHSQKPASIGAWIAGEPIEYGSLKQTIQTYLAERGMEAPKDEMLYRQITFNVLRDLAEIRVLENEAKQLNLALDLSDKDLNELNELDTDMPSGFDSLADDRNEWKERLKKRISLLNVAAEVSKNVSADIQISDQQLKDEYERNRELYFEPVSFDLRMIRVFDQKLAETIRKNVQKGWSFLKLAEQYSTLRDAGAAGALMHISLSEFPPDVGPELSTLAERKISPVLATDDGFFIVYIEKRYPERSLSFEDVRDRIYDDLISRERSHRYREWMKGKVAGMSIQIGTPIPIKELTDENTH